MAIGATTHSKVAFVRLTLRSLQFIFSVLAMAFAAAGFFGGSSSRATTFVLLMGYTGMLYTLFYIAVIEISHLAGRPALRLEQGMDGLLALLLLVSGICLVTSDYTENCSYGWHCHNLRAASAFAFVATFFFLVSLALSCKAGGEHLTHGHAGHTDLEEPVPYHHNATPTSGALSPVGRNEPAARV